ncbi:MAG: hypothetical protein K0S56_2007 [Microvirga sp.]|nr:hypothetical protein [Microvirga sp.]
MREERLRATAGLRSSPALSSWRGRSGRRYIVGVHSLSSAELMEVTDAVILAVRRDASGTSSVVDMTTVGPRTGDDARTGWLAKVQHLGATEMHVHRLAYDDRERRAVIADLNQDDNRAAC